MSLSEVYFYVAREILTFGVGRMIPESVLMAYNVYRVSEVAYQTVIRTSYIMGRTYGMARWVFGSGSPSKVNTHEMIVVHEDDDFVIIS